MAYDFSKINDKEFEILACDLLTGHFGKKVERFKPGKDGGVDGRFFVSAEDEVIIQCKHYLGSGYKALVSKLKSEELKKVVKLAPSDYILVTSLPLSRANKKELFTIFKDYMTSESCIYGQEDLNDLLERCPEIVERHYKLWFTSTHVLKNLLNAAIKGRSEYEIERIAENAPLYVETEYHSKALEHLKERHVLIITGEPGIGKTTLAENLCLYFASKGFEFLDIESSLSEAETAYSRGSKQIFLFDDFLGSNFLEAIENKKDSHIVKFIDRIAHDKTKRFILTSRTNILNSGILHSSYFQNSNMKTTEFQLEVTGFTKFDKARILYNHMWFSNLTQDFMEEIYKERRYRTIIEHANYNPRLVAFVTDSSRVPVYSAEAYWQYIENSLDNPKDIWSDCFKRQSNVYVRNLVCLCVFNGGTIDEEDLKVSYSLLNELEGTQHSTHTMKDFDSMTRLCTKAFLNRNRRESRTYYSLFNPSLADYVISEFSSDTSKLASIFHALRTMSAIENVNSLAKESVIDTNLLDQIRQDWFDSAISAPKSSPWGWSIVEQHISDPSKHEHVVKFAEVELCRAPTNKDMTPLLNILWHVRSTIDSQRLVGFLERILASDVLYRQELGALAPFVEEYFPDDTQEYSDFCGRVQTQIEEDVEEAANSMDLSDYVDFVPGYEGEGDADLKTDEVYEKLQEAAEESLDELNCSFIESDLDMDKVTENIDADEMLDDFLKSSYEPDYESHGGGGGGATTSDPIDDLFERQ